MDMPRRDGPHGPWNPGLGSQIPRAVLALSTMFRAENVTTGCDEAHELADLAGLSPFELVRFRPGRLAVHELLVRVTADLSVPDGPNYEDLGISFREIAGRIHDRYIAPELARLARIHDGLRHRAGEFIARELAARPDAGAGAGRTGARPGSIRIPFRRRTLPSPPVPAPDRAAAALAGWRARLGASHDPVEAACLAALIRIVTAVLAHRGRLIADSEVLAGLATTLVANGHGSEMIGREIEPLIAEAARREPYSMLPVQQRPVVMNVKGASAAGKSSIRPQQRALAERLGVPWEHFALISPDIWRKFLLDYSSLGEAYKYAGSLTGHELEIIDKKLDRYMAHKAARGRVSHMLIDRFRFDSFTVVDGRDVDSTLLTRFGDLIFMFFMITPPDATVERAWARGLKFGRYKAVDDLLHHNVEAFNGMPQLFFSWASTTSKRVHYEFLDNSVAEGARPRTVAFGWNGTMTILDIALLLDIERYKKINVAARAPREVYRPDRMAPEQNTAFLAECARRISEISFADRDTGRLIGQIRNGAWVWRDPGAAARVLADPDWAAGLAALGWESSPLARPQAAGPVDLEAERALTLGDW